MSRSVTTFQFPDARVRPSEPRFAQANVTGSGDDPVQTIAEHSGRGGYVHELTWGRSFSGTSTIDWKARLTVDGFAPVELSLPETVFPLTVVAAIVTERSGSYGSYRRFSVTGPIRFDDRFKFELVYTGTGSRELSEYGAVAYSLDVQ